MKDWFVVNNIEKIDSPALLVYADRVKDNINLAVKMVGNDPGVLRPHVKTNKMPEVCKLMLAAGITKFKCATIAEAEMLAQAGAPDILLAYQPVGPKILRLTALIKAYPSSLFSCLTDSITGALSISEKCEQEDVTLRVFIDLNVGMNRTGIVPEKALELYRDLCAMKGIIVIGLHAYDGHLHDEDLNKRQQKSDEAFTRVFDLSEQIRLISNIRPTIVVGGTPTFPTHLKRAGVECSPGTFVFWDWNYKRILQEQSFNCAALVLTRVISIISDTMICTDLGHKSVAAENPLPRVYFLNAENAEAVGQSEEHLVLQVQDASKYKIGDVLYGVPYHICPTVALYEKAFVVTGNEVTDEWRITARDRYIKL